MQDHEVVLIIVTLMIFAGVGVLYMAMSNRRAWREMEHRERLAMIQRGLIPSPEADPMGFEASTAAPYDMRRSARSERWRSAGMISVGFGLAIMMLLTFTAGEPGVGIGVGGAFAVLGATLLMHGSHLRVTESYRPRYPVQGAARYSSHPNAGPPGSSQPPEL